MTTWHVCCSSVMYESSVKLLKETVAAGSDAAKMHQMCAECHSVSLHTLTTSIVNTCHHRLELPHASSVMNADQL